MFKSNTHSAKTALGLLVVAATLFCVLFGQGAHLHELGIHISSHFDVHVHLHAHGSHDQPLQADHNQEDNKHHHQVSKASDIIGTLTTSLQVKPDVKTHAILSFDEGHELSNRVLNETPTIFDLPPPRPVTDQYYISSFSFRGPPIA